MIKSKEIPKEAKTIDWHRNPMNQTDNNTVIGKWVPLEVYQKLEETMKQWKAYHLKKVKNLEGQLEEVNKTLNELPLHSRGLKYPPEFKEWLEQLRDAANPTKQETTP